MLSWVTEEGQNELKERKRREIKGGKFHEQRTKYRKSAPSLH